MADLWDLTRIGLKQAQQCNYEVAVLGMGAIEPHNWHLPEGHDYLHTTHVSRRCCEMAWEQCESVVWLPTVPYGVDCNLLEFPLAIHVSQATLDAMVRDIVGSLRRHGIRKIVLINGHGGNDFSPLVRQLQCDLDVFMFVCNWWQVGHDRYGEMFEAPDDHAGEFETSVGLALYEKLVDIEAAGPGTAKPFRFEALEKGWVRTSRDFAKLNDHCAVGDPSAATAEKGRRYLDLVCGRISEFLVQLARSPIDESFPMTP